MSLSESLTLTKASLAASAAKLQIVINKFEITNPSGAEEYTALQTQLNETSASIDGFLASHPGV